MSGLVLPGEVLDPSSLPTPTKVGKSLKVGPGLQQSSTSTELRAVVAGTLVTDNKKNAVWVEAPEGRYAPTANDPVIATVLRSTGESFLCSLSAHSPPSSLPHLAFDGVSRKTRPQLSAGTLVYARVASASRFLEPELTCIDPNGSGGAGGGNKGSGLGELRGGMVFDVSLGFARRLLVSKQREKAGVAVLEELAERGLSFEVAVGRNGRVWVGGEDQKSEKKGGGDGGGDGIRRVLVVGKALMETDRGNLDVEEQKKLVKKLVKTLS